MTRIEIIGPAIRQNLRARPGARIDPLFRVIGAQPECTIYGARIDGPLRICYDPLRRASTTGSRPTARSSSP
ncbi:MAG TPA: hypothetical protein VF897_04640, partial [Roseiflexaceae bacterium]